MRWTLILAVLACFIVAAAPAGAQSRPRVVTGSKMFPESWILGEALVSLASATGQAEAAHRSNLGGTDIVFSALRSGEIDAYVEYTGTIVQVFMKDQAQPTRTQMREFLARQGIGMTDSLGFNDGYALAVTPATQKKYSLNRISDLAQHPQLRLGLTHEFIDRQDGWQGLSRHYGLSLPNVRGIQHELAYTALANGQIDVTEIYTTDAQIQKLNLVLLEDDRNFFPKYHAVILYRLDLPKRAPAAFTAMERLIGTISEPQMIRANAMVALEKRTQGEAAAALLESAVGKVTAGAARPQPSLWREIGLNVLRHLQLVAISLLAAIALGVPLGVLATRSRLLANLTLSGSGVLQTIPSLALLAFLVPQFGIGVTTALIALFLYSLLPIVRNTYTGLTTIPPNLGEAAEALGMKPLSQLLRVRLPMASPAIMAGIKTSAVINVGTATLAALIGAGGLGEPILRGIALLNTSLILQGAVPAAVLALLVQGGFDLLDHLIVPRGLRLRVEPAS